MLSLGQTGLRRDLPHGARGACAHVWPKKVENMDMDPDLFSPADTAALLAIRAVIANRPVSPLELQALFDARGLLCPPGARAAGVQAIRKLLRPPSSR
jgi:hypothetical protein